MKIIFIVIIVVISSIVTAAVTTLFLTKDSRPVPVDTPAEVLTNESDQSALIDVPSGASTENQTAADEILGGDLVPQVVVDEPGSTVDLVAEVTQTTFIDEQHRALELEVDALRKEIDGYKQRGEIVPTSLLTEFNATDAALNAYIDAQTAVVE